jgi:integrase
LVGSGGPHLPGVRRIPTETDLEEAAVALGYELPTETANASRKSLRGKGAAFYNAHVNFVQAELAEQARAAATGDHSLVRDLADEAIEELGFDLTVDSAAYAKLCDLLNAARLAGLREQHQRNMGDLDATPASNLVQRVRQRDAAKAKPGETLLELFERWSAEMLAKGAKRPDTVEQDRKVIERFATFVGVDRDAATVTPVEVAEYRDTLRDLPPKWMSKRELRSLDMRAAAEKARAMDMPRTAFTNINKHLSTISPLYKWLAAQPRWAGLRNPCDGLFFDGVKGKNRRPSFSTEMLNKILSSPLFAGFKADGQEHLPGHQLADDWRKWIPLACLFTGARIGEIAQLRLADVRKERGVWFIYIRHDEDEGLSTKSGNSRPAAVHPLLERLGFLSFYSRQLERAGGDTKARLFPELTANARGQISGAPSRWWRDYLEAIGAKSGRDGYGAHSFRHTLADRLRSEAELLDYQVAVCLGHSVKSTTSGYGELSQGTVNMLKAWMDAVSFDGVDFSTLVTFEGPDE